MNECSTTDALAVQAGNCPESVYSCEISRIQDWIGILISANDMIQRPHLSGPLPRCNSSLAESRLHGCDSFGRHRPRDDVFVHFPSDLQRAADHVAEYWMGNCPRRRWSCSTGMRVVVGTEALRSSVAMPERVVQNAKRYMGDPHKCWVMDGTGLSPVRHLRARAPLSARRGGGAAGADSARGHHRARPIQRSSSGRTRSRQATRRDWTRVDLINEPVAAALCYVLGNRGDLVFGIGRQSEDHGL